MKRYPTLAAQFKEYLRGLHVVTMVAEKNPERPQYFEAEEKALKSGVPMAVLLDQDGSVTEAVNPSVSPMICLVDRQGVVRGEGWLTGADLWESLAAAEAGGAGAGQPA